MHRVIGRRHFAAQRDHQSNSQLGHSNRIRARRVHHHNAVPRRRFHIDVVHAHTRAAHHAQLRRVLQQLLIHLHGGPHHQRIGFSKSSRQTLRQLVVRLHFPTRLSRKHGHRRRRNLLCQNNLHRRSPALLAILILVKTNTVLLAQQLKHAHRRRMRLALAPLVLGHRVGMHPQPLGHLVLIEVQLPPRNQQLLSKRKFSHKNSSQLSVDSR